MDDGDEIMIADFAAHEWLLSQILVARDYRARCTTVSR